MELTFKANPEWSGVGRMEKPALAILGARGALDTTEMKARDDQATAVSNTEDFLELCRGDRGARQTGTFADACQCGAACVCVARRGCPGRNATRRSLQVYASALLLLLLARPLAELEKKITMACVQSRPQAAETADRLIHPESPGPSLSNMPLTWHIPVDERDFLEGHTWTDWSYVLFT